MMEIALGGRPEDRAKMVCSRGCIAYLPPSALEKATEFPSINPCLAGMKGAEGQSVMLHEKAQHGCSILLRAAPSAGFNSSFRKDKEIQLLRIVGSQAALKMRQPGRSISRLPRNLPPGTRHSRPRPDVSPKPSTAQVFMDSKNSELFLVLRSL